MLDDGGGGARGDHVTRVWQPTPAPDAVAVDAPMPGPPTPTQQTGRGVHSHVYGRARAPGAWRRTTASSSGSDPSADNNARRKQRAAFNQTRTTGLTPRMTDCAAWRIRCLRGRTHATRALVRPGGALPQTVPRPTPQR